MTRDEGNPAVGGIDGPFCSPQISAHSHSFGAVPSFSKLIRESKMITIGENLNLINKGIGRAIKEKDPKPIREMAEKLAAAKMDFIDINLGPARKGGEELMTWVVQTVQEVTDIPLSLDTSNIAAIEAGLKVHKGKAIINFHHGPAGTVFGHDPHLQTI